MHFGSSPKNPRSEMTIFGLQAHPNFKLLAKNAVFRLKSMFLSYNGGVEAKNEVSTLKIFLETLLGIFGAGRNFFDHPAPKRLLFRLSDFSTKSHFCQKSGFSRFCCLCGPKWARCRKIFSGQKHPLRPLFSTKNQKKSKE